MRGCILQPGYLPWLGFFEQFIFSERFVFLDDVQYTRQDWRNRNRVRSNAKSGWTWLTVPIKAHRTVTKINEVKIDYQQNWIKKHVNIIKNNYQKSRYFQEINPIILSNLMSEPVYLADLNIQLVLDIANYLGIHRQTIRSSDLNISEQEKNQRLLNICLQTDIDQLYDGEKAKDFLDFALFAHHGISVGIQIYDHPEYTQTYEPFLPYMSIIDLLFHYGKQSVAFIVRTPEVKCLIAS